MDAVMGGGGVGGGWWVVNTACVIGRNNSPIVDDTPLTDTCWIKKEIRALPPRIPHSGSIRPGVIQKAKKQKEEEPGMKERIK